MGNISTDLPVRVKGAVGGQQQQQQPPPPPNPPQPPQPLTGKMSKSEKRRKRQEKLLEEARKQARADFAAELASKGIDVPPEEDTDQMQVDTTPARTLTPGQQMRKQELLNDLETEKGIRKEQKEALRTLKASLETTKVAIVEKEEALRQTDDSYNAIVRELKTLS